MLELVQSFIIFFLQRLKVNIKINPTKKYLSFTPMSTQHCAEKHNEDPSYLLVVNGTYNMVNKITQGMEVEHIFWSRVTVIPELGHKEALMKGVTHELEEAFIVSISTLDSKIYSGKHSHSNSIWKYDLKKQ